MNEEKKEKKKSPRAPRSANWTADETLRFVSALVHIGRNGILNQATNGCTPERRAHEYEKIASTLNSENASTVGTVRHPLHLQNRFKQIKQYLQTYTTWQRQVAMGTGGGLGKPMPVSPTIPLTGAMVELLGILQDRFCGLQTEGDSDTPFLGANKNKEGLDQTRSETETQLPTDTQTLLVIDCPHDTSICNSTTAEVDIGCITEEPLQALQNETPSSAPRQYFATATQQLQSRKRKLRSPNENEIELRKQLIELELKQSRELHSANLNNARELQTANMEAVMLQKAVHKRMFKYFDNREREAQERHNHYLKMFKSTNVQTTEVLVQEEAKMASIYEEVQNMHGMILPPKEKQEHSEQN